jgi:hypothetical protein
MRLLSALVLALPLAALADEIDDAKKRWADSPHGPLLERILPPTFGLAQLPALQAACLRHQRLVRDAVDPGLGVFRPRGQRQHPRRDFRNGGLTCRIEGP